MTSNSMFYHLKARRDDARNSTKNFMVKSVKKDGSISKMALTDSDWRLNAFEERADAEKRVAALEAMNPGRSFAIVTL